MGTSVVTSAASPLPAARPAPTARPLLDAAGARAGDRAAVDAGDTWAGLMDRAAGHLARGVVAFAGRGYGLKVTIVVGSGNNGGDGWVAATRLEREHGAQVWVVSPRGLDVDLSAEAAAGRARWLASGGRTSAQAQDLDRALAWCDVAVDAVLGTGISGEVRGEAAEATAALRRAHDAGTPVIACDVPSGVASDDGHAASAAVRADLTVTFGALKRGLVLHPGAAHAGRVVLADLGSGFRGALPAAGTPGWWTLTAAGAAPDLLDVAVDKRARGTVLALAGGPGTGGAAALCASAALRSGAGLVSLATPDPLRAEVAARTDAGVMVRGLAADADGGLADGALGDDGAAAAGSVDSLVDAVDAVVAGPGLGVGAGARAAIDVLRARARRLVLDADALNVHRDDPETLADHAGALVLTPHERELARIGGGTDGPDAFTHRVERVPELAERLDATIVAKGPGTIVAAPDGRVWVTPLGGPALGSGGTGDVLAGVIAAAIAPAHDVPLAVARAVWWHAAAGEVAGQRCAGRATASDLLGTLPVVLDALARGRLREVLPDTRAGIDLDHPAALDATRQPAGDRGQR